MAIVQLIADIFPASVTPLPEGVPQGQRLRVLITVDSLVIGWMAGAQNGAVEIHSVVLPMTEEQTAEASFRGGRVGDYTVALAGGCSTCGAAKIRSWRPFGAGAVIQQVNRQEQAAAAMQAEYQQYGVPPRRGGYSRRW